MRVRLMLVREGRARNLTLGSPQEVYAFMRKKAHGLDREHFWRIDLDTRSKLLGYEVVSIGTLSASLVHPREVFKGAILSNAAAIIIAHNHPSQDVQPSAEDREVTRRLTRAGELLGVPVLDHMVLGDEAFFSFKERGLL